MVSVNVTMATATATVKPSFCRKREFEQLLLCYRLAPIVRERPHSRLFRVLRGYPIRASIPLVAFGSTEQDVCVSSD